MSPLLSLFLFHLYCSSLPGNREGDREKQRERDRERQREREREKEREGEGERVCGVKGKEGKRWKARKE